MIRVFAVFCVTLVIGTGASPAFAQSEGPISAAVLNLQGKNVDAELVSTLSSIVRNEAQQLDRYQVVNKFEINFEDILLVLGCSADSPTCLKQAAEQVNARVLIFGSVTKVDPDIQLDLSIFDSESGRYLNTMSSTVPASADPVVDIRKEIEAFFRKEKAAPTTRIRIGSNVNDAEIHIEDTFVGKVPLERKGLPAGRYKVEVKHPDYQTWETVLELKSGADLELWAPLKPKAVVASPVILTPEDSSNTVYTDTEDRVTDRDQISSPNWGAWSAVTVGGLALVGSGVFALLMVNTEDQINDESASGELTEARYNELVDRGENFELTHRVLLGVGAVGIISGVVWLLVDGGSDSQATLDIGLSGPTRVQATLRW